MAKLDVDLDAIWIRELLNRGKREEALARIKGLVGIGEAGSDVLTLADYLAKAGKGRQPFGSKYLWVDIGRDNDEMRDDGKSHAFRIAELSRTYNLGNQKRVEEAIAKWERAMDVVRALERREAS